MDSLSEVFESHRKRVRDLEYSFRTCLFLLGVFLGSTFAFFLTRVI